MLLKPHGFKAFGQLFAVAFVEDFVEIVGVFEAFVVVIGVFGKNLVFDQIKDYVAKIISCFDPPVFKHCHGHGTEFSQQKGFDPC